MSARTEPASAERAWAGRTLAAVFAAALAAGACATGQLAFDRLPATSTSGAPERFGQGLLGVNARASTMTFTLARDAEVAIVRVSPDGRVRPAYPLGPGESSRFTAGLHTVDIPEMRIWSAPPAAPTTAQETERWRAYNACIARNRDQGRMPQEKGRLSPDSGRPAATAPEPSASSPPTESQCGIAPVGRAPATGGAGVWVTENDVIVLSVSESPVTSDELRRRVAGARVRSEADLHALPARVTGDRPGPWAGYFMVRILNPRSQESR